jgi:myo-inositol 2-dehydrogenase/D-chiro-inositol 1-dehydrogenase
MTISNCRIALAGFGAWGQMHGRAISQIDDAEIVAVYCHGPNSVAAAREQIPDARRFDDYGAMLAAGNFDVVDITVPNHVHANFAVAALEAGGDVFLEKPLGLTLSECDAVIETSARTGKLVALNHELRVSKQWGAVRELIAAGDLGQLRYQHLSLFRHPFRQGSGGWRYDADKVGSWILEELVHFFDLVLWYGAENGKPARVHAYGNGRDNGPDNRLTDNFTAIVEWRDGATAILSQCLSGFEHHTLLEVSGEDGAIRTWWSGAQDRTLHPDFDLKVRRGGGDVETVPIPVSGEIFELEENIRCALAGFSVGKSILSPTDTRVAIEVCLAAEAAYRTGVPVQLSRDTHSHNDTD